MDLVLGDHEYGGRTPETTYPREKPRMRNEFSSGSLLEAEFSGDTLIYIDCICARHQSVIQIALISPSPLWYCLLLPTSQVGIVKSSKNLSLNQRLRPANIPSLSLRIGNSIWMPLFVMAYGLTGLVLTLCTMFPHPLKLAGDWAANSPLLLEEG